MGSGGHTTEMCNIVQHLSSAYTNPLFVIAETDSLSEDKVCIYYVLMLVAGWFPLFLSYRALLGPNPKGYFDSGFRALLQLCSILQLALALQRVDV